ncbi:reverse transcriptase domain-containing protein [Tanacetum coccineum]
MTLELANQSVTHPVGIAEDVIVRVNGFTFLADFVVVNFKPDPRVPISLGRPFIRSAKALIDLYEEKLTLRVGNDELVFYADKSEKRKNKQFAHAISIIDFSKDEPFSGSTTIHSNALPPSSSLVKTSDNLEEFADELTLLDSFHPDDVENENSNVSNSDEPVLLNTPLSNKVECSDLEVDIDEIDAFLAMEVSSNFEDGYYDSEGDVSFLESLLSDDTTHNLSPKVIFDHEPKQNESIHNSSITFSPRNDHLHHEFAGEIITNPSRIPREHEEYLSLMTLLCEISTSRSPENFHANPSSIITSPFPVEDSDPVQEEIDIFLIPDDLIPPGVEYDDSEDEDNSTFLPEHESSYLDHQDNPSSPRPLPEPPNVCSNFKPDTAMKNDCDNKDFNQGEIVLSLNAKNANSFTFVIWTFLPYLTYPEDSPVILSFRSTDKAKIPRKRLKLGKLEHKKEEHAKSWEKAIKVKSGQPAVRIKQKPQETGKNHGANNNWGPKKTIQVLKYTLAATNIIHKLSLTKTQKGMQRWQLNGRRAYNGRALMDFYWLISDKPKLLISSFEHFSFCLAESLFAYLCLILS